MLVEAQESGQVLDEEQLAFLADLVVAVGQDTQITMLINDAFQTDDLDAFDSDYDEAPRAQAVLMANLSSYDSDVISEVPNSDNYQNNVVSDMCVQEESYSEQLTFNLNPDIDITSDSNIISYEQCLQETKIAKCTADNLKHKELDASLTVELESYKEQVKQFKERQNVDLNNHEKYIESQMNDMILSKNAKFAAFQKEIDTLKFNLSKHKKENASLITKIDALKKQSKEKEDKYTEEAIDLEKKRIRKHCLQVEQAFWLRISNPIFEQPGFQSTPVKTKAPRELPKCSLDKKYFEIETNELSLDNDRLLKHIICQDAMNVEIHANVHSHNMLPANTNSLEHDNSASELLKHENDRLMELLISQDLVHTAVNSLAAINDYKSMEKSF
ncbi:hypothetical protein Tco_1305791 [Tanacetum coccineum]